jgi:serine/threonine-protein kinase ULK/ATG1
MYLVVSSMRGRLASVRKKVAALSKRSSASTPVGSAGKVPLSNIVPVAPTTGVTPPR